MSEANYTRSDGVGEPAMAGQNGLDKFNKWYYYTIMDNTSNTNAIITATTMTDYSPSMNIKDLIVTVIAAAI